MELLPHRQLQVNKTILDKSLLSTIAYHDVFGFPLKKEEVLKWKVGIKVKGKNTKDNKSSDFQKSKGFYFMEEREELVLQRKLRGETSKEKMKIAVKGANILSKIPTVKMVGVTGSLAMMNARDESDIDLMIVTSKNSLWTTRLLSIILLRVAGYALRRAKDKDEKDKLCLNIWMDEGDLKITKKNIYTAHEIAQIVPLINKDKTYERLLWENKWLLNYWPSAIEIPRPRRASKLQKSKILSVFEWFAFKLQYQFMKRKITREVVTPTRAFFHPFDWGKFVLDNAKLFW